MFWPFIRWKTLACRVNQWASVDLTKFYLMVYPNDVVKMYTERLAALFNPVKVKMHVINTLIFFDVES